MSVRPVVLLVTIRGPGAYLARRSAQHVDRRPRRRMFLRKLPDGGSVQHMTVLLAEPGRTLRLRGSLGPLQEQAVVGTMT